MDTTAVKMKKGKPFNQFGEQIITCTLCNEKKTTMLGTRRCDRCWELESRINADWKLALKIVAILSGKSSE